MLRHALPLLFIAATGSCAATSAPPGPEDPNILCPCVIFKLEAVNGQHLPYVPPNYTNPGMLVESVLVFEADGRSSEISKVRSPAASDTTVRVVREFGLYAITPPIVKIRWRQAGELVYAINNDSLSTRMKGTNETWLYKRQ